MEMFWSKEGELQFRVHLKVNQQLKYLTRGSTHTNACFQAIPLALLRRLATLTMKTDKSTSKRLDKLYQSHAKALKVAKLAPEIFPTLGKTLEKIVTKPDTKDRKDKK